MMHGFLNKVQHGLARSRGVSRLMVRVRNQVNCVVAFHLGETADSDKNGESLIIDTIAPTAHRFVDVGANVGEWTEMFLAKSGPATHGILFEPSVHSYKHLQGELAGRNVEIRNFAVGDAPGEVSFVEDVGYSQASSIASSYVQYTDKQELRTVRVVTLDDELHDSGDIYDLLKVDTEGYDMKVLKGAKRLLQDGRVRFVQFEYNTQWLGVGSSLREASSFLSAMGYEMLLIRSTGLHPLNYEFWGDYFRYSNFLAFRPENRALVQSLIRERI